MIPSQLLYNKPDIHRLAFKIAQGRRVLADIITERIVEELQYRNLSWREVQVIVMGYYNHPLQQEYADHKLFLRRYFFQGNPGPYPPVFKNKEEFEQLRPLREKWASFEQAKAYLKTLGLESFPHWRSYIKSGELPRNIPRSPEMFYREQWAGWRDFLGITPYLLYSDCKEWVKNNLVCRGIFSYNQWAKITKYLPPFIPANPDSSYYNKGWKSWAAFFEAPSKKELLLTYEEARLFSHEYLVPAGIDSTYKYNMIRTKSLYFLPTDLRRYYAKQGWSQFDFFKKAGRRRAGKQNYLAFDEAREFVQQHLVSKGIDSVKKWNDLVDGNIDGLTVPANIPLQPWAYYQRAGWQGNRYWFDPHCQRSDKKKQQQ